MSEEQIIDFDEASRYWMLNKRKLQNGFYQYKCACWKAHKNAYCKNKPAPKAEYCKYHLKTKAYKDKSTFL
jgi:hypothetical protein